MEQSSSRNGSITAAIIAGESSLVCTGVTTFEGVWLQFSGDGVVLSWLTTAAQPPSLGFKQSDLNL